MPYFRRSEDYTPGADEFHGTGGEWRVEATRLRWEILDAFRDAAVETGIPPTEARALVTRGDDYRIYQSTTSAFIPWFPKKESTP